MKGLDFDLLRTLTEEGKIEERDMIITEFERDAREELKALKVEGKEEVINEVTSGKRFLNIRCWTDVTPCIITKVINAKTIEVMKLDTIGDWRFIKTPSQDLVGLQEWIIFKGAYEEKVTFTLRKNGRWVEKGHTTRNGYVGTMSEKPTYHYDWNF